MMFGMMGFGFAKEFWDAYEQDWEERIQESQRSDLTKVLAFNEADESNHASFDDHNFID